VTVAEAIATGSIGERLWFYTNYHCNLACRYCLTSSSPNAPRRELKAEVMTSLAEEAVELGFRSLGITGGEPFMRAEMPLLLAQLAERLPVVVLTNGTLFTKRFVERLRPLARHNVALQVSLDSADPTRNDALRGEGNHARVLTGIRQLRASGIRVRIGTTSDGCDRQDLLRLCELHRSMGIDDDDHVVRPIIRRGRADEAALGIDAQLADLPAELTITAEGAFWSPASPTVTGERLDIAELLTRTIRPLRIPAQAMLRFAAGGILASSGLVA
jgi:MoaA/NifB/PqqE/SkfB family radical SAM enzyme